MICPECGSEIEKNVNKCKECGYVFKNTEKVEFKDSKKSVNKKFLLIILIVALIVVA